MATEPCSPSCILSLFPLMCRHRLRVWRSGQPAMPQLFCCGLLQMGLLSGLFAAVWVLAMGAEIPVVLLPGLLRLCDLEQQKPCALIGITGITVCGNVFFQANVCGSERAHWSARCVEACPEFEYLLHMPRHVERRPRGGIALKA